MEHFVILFLSYTSGVNCYSLTIDIGTPPLNTLYKWKQMDYIFNSQKHRAEALRFGIFVPENVMPFGVDVWKDRLFLSLPAWRPGVPATLATIPKGGGLTSPPLKVYPDWDFHRTDKYDITYINCSNIISAMAIRIDECGRLWVLDSGQIDSHEDAKQVCRPSLALFDLRTDILIGRYVIPNKFSKPDSFYTNIVVDTRTTDCSDAHVYIADTHGFGLLVFRHRGEKFWRFNHHLFYPDPDASNFNLNGLSFQLSDGIYALSLGLVDKNDDRQVYIHALSSYREIHVRASVLRNPLKVNSKNEFNFYHYQREALGQSSSSIIDHRGVMFFGLVVGYGIACWDTRKAFEKHNQEIITADMESLNFISDIKVDKEDMIYLITNRFPEYREHKLKYHDFKYRILTADAYETVRGTPCDPESPEYKTDKRKSELAYTRVSHSPLLTNSTLKPSLKVDKVLRL